MLSSNPREYGAGELAEECRFDAVNPATHNLNREIDRDLTASDTRSRSDYALFIEYKKPLVSTES